MTKFAMDSALEHRGDLRSYTNGDMTGMAPRLWCETCGERLSIKWCCANVLCVDFLEVVE